MSIFTRIINEVVKNKLKFTEPKPFQKFIAEDKEQGKNVHMTAQHISIDFLDKLDSELKKNKLMVFRLGKDSNSSGTSFALASVQDSWDDYFFFDKTLYLDLETSYFKFDNNDNSYMVYKALPKLTENSLVNLCISSGIMHKALKIRGDKYNLIPATCQSTFSFTVRPHASLEAEWNHQKGQVEVDSLFYGIRNDKPELFIVEAKNSISNKTLAKHKLYYPYQAIKNQAKEKISKDLKITPVYLKTSISDNNINFYITECCFLNDDDRYLSNLIPKQTSHFILRDFL